MRSRSGETNLGHSDRHSDRGALAVAIVTLVALVGGGLTWAAVSGDSTARAARVAAQGSSGAPLATLRVIEPNAELRRDGRTDFRPGRNGQGLRQGDTVRTDTVGLAEIAYSDGSLTRLGPATEFTIAELTDERGGRQTRGSLSIGETWSRAAKVAETGHFEVQAGGTTAAVEGTAFAFSCTRPAGVLVCEVIDIVDNVNVTNDSGDLVPLSPATSVTATDDALGALTRLTREQLLANQFIVDNLLLDQAAGLGLGLGDLPPPSTTTTVTSAGPLVVAFVQQAPTVVVEDTPPPPPPVDEPLPPPPPPSAPECVDGGWTALVGAAGETFASEQACIDFVLGGGTLAQTGGGRFVVPSGATVALSGQSFTACNALQFGYEINLVPASQALVGVPKANNVCSGSLGGGTIGPFPTAVLLRVFLQDDSCAEVRFFSDGNHAQVSPDDASQVWIMDADDGCAASGPAPRPPVADDLNLVVTVAIG